MKAFRITCGVALFLATTSAGALAQGECKIDYGKPRELKDAEGLLKKFELLGKPEERKQSYIQAVTKLTKEPAKLEVNKVGRNMVMGRALADLAALPDVPGMARRGDVGFYTDSSKTVDLVLGADSAFDAVEAELPACKTETEEYRLKVFAKLVNDAVNAYNSQSIDSAEVWSRRGLAIYDGYWRAYIAYNVLGNVQQSKDDYPGAINSFKKMADLIKGDSALADERRNTIVLVSQLMILDGKTKEGDAKKKALAETVSYLEGLLSEYPLGTPKSSTADTAFNARVQSGITQAQLASGDSVTARKVFSNMLANPDRYGDVQILEAGVGAAQADMHADAAELFKAGLKKNPYARDGLFNLAATFDQLGQADSMPPLLNRLLAIDPNNPENFRLWARYWKAKNEAAKPAATKEKATEADQALYKQTTDSLIMWYDKMNSAPVKVTFNLFSHDGPKHVLGGSIDNLTDTDSVSYSLTIDFLDSGGAVLGTKDVPIEIVGAKGAKAFKVQLDDKPGVVAFRYIVVSDIPPSRDATALCKDGTVSQSQSRPGTCSKHGGVKEWKKPPSH